MGTTAEVRADIERWTSWNVGKGPLTTADVDRLVLLARRPDADGNEPDVYSEWTAATTLAVGTKRVPVERNGWVFRVSAITTGITGAAEPTWPTTLGATVVDAGVTWTADALAPWTGVWDAKEAAAIGCEWRAVKLADQFEVAVGSGKQFKRQWTPEFWLRLAATYRGESVAGIQNAGSGSGAVFTAQLRGAVHAGE